MGGVADEGHAGAVRPAVAQREHVVRLDVGGAAGVVGGFLVARGGEQVLQRGRPSAEQPVVTEECGFHLRGRLALEPHRGGPVLVRRAHGGVEPDGILRAPLRQDPVAAAQRAERPGAAERGQVRVLGGHVPCCCRDVLRAAVDGLHVRPQQQRADPGPGAVGADDEVIRCRAVGSAEVERDLDRSRCGVAVAAHGQDLVLPLDHVRGDVPDQEAGECVSGDFRAGLELPPLVDMQNRAGGVHDAHRLGAIAHGGLEAVPQPAFAHRREPGFLVEIQHAGRFGELLWRRWAALLVNRGADASLVQQLAQRQAGGAAANDGDSRLKGGHTVLRGEATFLFFFLFFFFFWSLSPPFLGLFTTLGDQKYRERCDERSLIVNRRRLLFKDK